MMPCETMENNKTLQIAFLVPVTVQRKENWPFFVYENHEKINDAVYSKQNIHTKTNFNQQQIFKER